MLKKTVFILFALLFVACVLGAQQSQAPANPPAQPPAEPKISAEDVKKVRYAMHRFSHGKRPVSYTHLTLPTNREV